VHADVVRHVPEHQRAQLGQALVEKTALVAHDRLGDLEDRPLALIDALEQPQRAAQLVLDVVARLFGPRALVVQHLPVGGTDPQAWQAVVVEHDLVVLAFHHDHHVRGDVVGAVRTVARPGAWVEMADDLQVV
jgi:hypothetical protein